MAKPGPKLYDPAARLHLVGPTVTPAYAEAVLAFAEELDLAAIGPLTITRASTIEFNAASQLWEVRLASSPATVVFSDPSREKCLVWERDKLNAQI